MREDNDPSSDQRPDPALLSGRDRRDRPCGRERDPEHGTVRYSEAFLYLYRPDRLEKDLAGEEARDLLNQEGYSDRNSEYCLLELIRRLRGRKAFPHEIGLFLSYPPEDVRGFIRYGGSHSKLTGCWQVYGDEEAARKTFERFDKCTRIYCRRWAEGVPLTRLAVAGV